MIVETLNEQIEAGYPTYLFIIGPEGSNMPSYRAAMQRVSLKSPPEKELIPAFYKELKILSRMKTWSMIGKLERFRISAIPGLKQANATYAGAEKLACMMDITSVPGYFELHQETSESFLRPA